MHLGTLHASFHILSKGKERSKGTSKESPPGTGAMVYGALLTLVGHLKGTEQITPVEDERQGGGAETGNFFSKS